MSRNLSKKSSQISNNFCKVKERFFHLVARKWNERNFSPSYILYPRLKVTVSESTVLETSCISFQKGGRGIEIKSSENKRKKKKKEEKETKKHKSRWHRGMVFSKRNRERKREKFRARKGNLRVDVGS